MHSMNILISIWQTGDCNFEHAVTYRQSRLHILLNYFIFQFTIEMYNACGMFHPWVSSRYGYCLLRQVLESCLTRIRFEQSVTS